MSGIVEVHNPVRVTAGMGAAATALARSPLGEHPVLLRDVAVELPASVREAARTEVVDPGVVDIDVLREVLGRADGATAIVAIGGGAVMDLAKLVRLLLAAPRLAGSLHARIERSGFVPIPERAVDSGAAPHLLAIPTTFGTGSEVSPTACIVTPSGRRLLSGTRLRPDHAAFDPALTRSLPVALQREGLMEVILRVVGPAIGSERVLAADHDARSVVWGAGSLLEQLRVAPLRGPERLHAAQLSAASHRSWALVGRDSFAAKHWYLANELSSVISSRKIPATVAILPSLWRRIAEGDERWGRRDRLREIWSWFTALVPTLADDVREGLPQLFARWGLEAARAPSTSDLREAAERCGRFWGGALPALRRISPPEIFEIFEDSFPEARADVPDERREEVRTRHEHAGTADRGASGDGCSVRME